MEAYAVNGELQPFTEMIASLEEQRLDEYLGIEQNQIPENEGPTMMI